MRKVAKKSKSTAAPSAPAPDLVYTPPRIREHLDRACALAKAPAPRKPSPKSTEDAREAAALAAAPVLPAAPGKKENSRESAPPVPAPEPTGIRPARNGGFDVFLAGKFRGWHKTEDAAAEQLRKLAARKGLAAVPPSAPASPEVQAAPAPASESPEPPAPVASEQQAPQSPVAFLLVNFSDEAIRAEAERRGLMKPAKAPKARTDRRPPANREEHAALTKQAWTKARELAASKGGKPTDHMKEAWAGLVRD